MILPRKKTAEHLETGRRGEDLAVEFLTKQGYTILRRNYRKRYGEIDIIATENNTLVFIEVKTRKSLQFGDGFEAVSYQKQLQLARVAQEYIQRYNMSDTCARFDVVSVRMGNNKQPQLELLQNAFEVTE